MKEKENKLLTTPTPPKEGLSEEKSQKVLGFGYITANSQMYNSLKDYRNTLKKKPTEAEKVIWEYLRNKKTGFRFRRQHIIDIYIPVFVCLTKKVVIEIDGKIHLKNKEKDGIRTCRFIELGYDILRFTNEEVLENPRLVFFKIKNYLENKEEIIKDQIRDKENELRTTPTPPKEGLSEEKIKVNKSSMDASYPPLEGLGKVVPIEDINKTAI